MRHLLYPATTWYRHAENYRDCQPAQLFELWPGIYCAECRSQGKRLELDKRIVVGPSLTEILDVHVLKLKKFL